MTDRIKGRRFCLNTAHQMAQIHGFAPSEVGIYFAFVLHYVEHGFLPADPAKLRAIIPRSSAPVKQARISAVLQRLFKYDGVQAYYNPDLDKARGATPRSVPRETGI